MEAKHGSQGWILGVEIGVETKRDGEHGRVNVMTGRHCRSWRTPWMTERAYRRTGKKQHPRSPIDWAGRAAQSRPNRGVWAWPVAAGPRGMLPVAVTLFTNAFSGRAGPQGGKRSMTTKPKHRRAVLEAWWRRKGLPDRTPLEPSRSERTSQGLSVMSVAWAAQAVRNA